MNKKLLKKGPEKRVAKCCYCDAERDSADHEKLPFFEDLSAGSDAAKRACLNCGYHKSAHEGTLGHDKRPNVVEIGQCSGFEPIVEFEHDRFYCGCRGWD